MPWCPKCKTEYIEGIELCADCHTPLVASLEASGEDEAGMKPGGLTEPESVEDTFNENEELMESEEPMENEESTEDEPMASAEDEPLTGEELRRQLSRPTMTYVKPAEQYKDTKSSGYMLTVIGAAGIIVLILIAAGVVPISLDPVMQYIFYGVLGILFIVFLVMGVNALKKAGEYKNRIQKEASLEEKLLAWLGEQEQKERLDQCQASENSPEEAYFACQDLMKQMLLGKEPDIKEDYMNYIIEKAYSQMYEA